jgi:hypothetical protein
MLTVFRELAPDGACGQPLMRFRRCSRAIALLARQ